MATLSSPTTDKLLIEVRSMLNQPDANNSNWSDAELIMWLNDAANRFFAEIVEYAEGQFTTQVDLDVVQNIDTVNLPADCYKVKAIYLAINNGYRIIPYQNWLNQSYDTDTALGSNTNAFTYYFRDNQLVLRPIPNFSQTAGLRMEYIAFPTQLIGAADSLDPSVSPVYKEMIVMYTVMKAKIRESLVTGQDTSALARQLFADIASQFKDVIRMRAKYPQYSVPFNP